MGKLLNHLKLQRRMGRNFAHGPRGTHPLPQDTDLLRIVQEINPTAAAQLPQHFDYLDAAVSVVDKEAVEFLLSSPTINVHSVNVPFNKAVNNLQQGSVWRDICMIFIKKGAWVSQENDKLLKSHGIDTYTYNAYMSDKNNHSLFCFWLTTVRGQSLSYFFEPPNPKYSNLHLDLTQVDAKDPLGYTAFLLAVEAGCSDNAQFLLGKGANINATTPNGITALHLAAQNRSVLGQVKRNADHILQALFANPKLAVDVNIQDSEGYTPLHCAVMACQPDCINLLGSKGANVNMKTKGANPVTPLDFIYKAMKAEREPVKLKLLKEICTTLLSYGAFPELEHKNYFLTKEIDIDWQKAESVWHQREVEQKQVIAKNQENTQRNLSNLIETAGRDIGGLTSAVSDHHLFLMRHEERLALQEAIISQQAERLAFQEIMISRQEEGMRALCNMVAEMQHRLEDRPVLLAIEAPDETVLE